MDLQYFWNILARRKWLILTVMLVTSLATYFFVDRLEPKYLSDAQFSTGIVDFKGIDVETDNFYLQKFTVEISFGNLIELMKSPRNLRFLTYRLLIHDLDGNETPFRTLDPEEEYDFNYSQEEIQHLVNVLSEKLGQLEVPLDDAKLDRAYRDLAEAYKYDYETLLEDNLGIERKSDTDFLTISFVSEDAELSRYAVDVFCSDFERGYAYLQEEEGNETVDFFSNEVQKKKAELGERTSTLNKYKYDRNLVDLEAQRNAIVTQITELELQRQGFVNEIPALRNSIADIQKRMSALDHTSANSINERVVLNQAIQNRTKNIGLMEEEYRSGGYTDKKLARTIVTHKIDLEKQLERLAKLEPQSEDDELDHRDESLLLRKVDLEVKLRTATESVSAIETELKKLDKKANSLVSSEAFVSNLENEIEILRTEYEQLYEKHGETKIELDDRQYPVKLVKYAQLADEPEENNQLIMTAFSGILSGTFCVVAIFFLAFMDTSLNNPHQFGKFTGLNPIGSVNKIDNKRLDIKQLYAENSSNVKRENFKESLRSLRYLIEESGAKKVLFTSTKPSEGKTFLIVNLAHVLTLKNKKVLLVDANFKNNSLTRMSKQDITNGLLNSRLIGEAKLEESFMTQSPSTPYNLEGVDIIGNKGTFQSPSEVFAGKDFHKFINDLSANYDFIFIESAALNNYSDTKEMIEYSDKVISVFSAESEINQTDKESINFLQSLGHRFMGAILNKVDLKNMN